MNAETTRRFARDAGLRAEDVGAAAGMDIRAAQDWLAGGPGIGPVQALRVRQEAWRRRRSELVSQAGLPGRCPNVPKAGKEGWAEHLRECPTCKGIAEACKPLGPTPSGDLWGHVLTVVMQSPLCRIPVLGRALRMVLWFVSLVPMLLLPVIGGGRRDTGLYAGAGCSLVFGGIVYAAAVVAGVIASLGPSGPIGRIPGAVFVGSAAAAFVLGLGARTLGRSHTALAVSAVIAALAGSVAYASTEARTLTLPSIDSSGTLSLVAVALLLGLLGISAVEGRIALELTGIPEDDSAEVQRNGI